MRQDTEKRKIGSHKHFKTKRGSTEDDTRMMIAILVALFYFLALGCFGIWFYLNGGLNEPWRQLTTFFGETKITTQNLSWQTRDIIIGFVFLDLGLSTIAIIILSLIFKKQPKIFFEKWKRFFSPKMPRLFYNLLGGVAAEEIVFRCFPLMILFPIWNTRLTLWIIIIGSSIAFAIAHLSNYQPGERKLYICLPQFISGIIYSYVLLAFGFWGVFAVHLIYDVLIIFPLKIAYSIDPQLL